MPRKPPGLKPPKPKKREPSRGGARGVTDAAVIKALTKNMGVIAYAAAELGVDRSVLHLRIEGNPMLKAAKAGILQVMLDVAEGTVLRSIASSPDMAWKLLQSSLGRERGYGSSVEVRHQLSPDQIAGIVASFGPDRDKLLAFLAALGT